jgi:hypothetical protein
VVHVLGESDVVKTPSHPQSLTISS